MDKNILIHFIMEKYLETSKLLLTFATANEKELVP